MSGMFTENNHLTEEGLAQYVEAMQFDRTQGLPEAVLEHVEICGQCHGEIVELYTIVQAIPNITEETLPEKKLHKQLLRLTILFAITLFSLFFFNKKGKEKILLPDVPLETKDSIKIPKEYSIPIAKKEIEKQNSQKNIQPQKTEDIQKKQPQYFTEEPFAANFIPSEDLEPLAGADLRAYGMENMKPETGSHFKVEEIITFSWNFEKEKIYWLYVVNNRESQLLQQAVSDTAFVYQLALNPGLYYWKIEDEEELLFVGKFFVEKE